jgi:hypothetical protein
MEQQGCGKILISVYPENFQHIGRYLMKPSDLEKIY